MHKLIKEGEEYQFKTQWQLAQAIGMVASDKKSIINRCERLGYSVTFGE